MKMLVIGSVLNLAGVVSASAADRAPVPLIFESPRYHTEALVEAPLPTVPKPIAAYISSDGTGAVGTWNPATSTGGVTALPTVPQPQGIYYSSDGSGAAGTWVPCTSACFGGGGGGAPSGPAGGDLAGTYPNPTLAPTGTAGTYGSSTVTPGTAPTIIGTITEDTKGRTTAVGAATLGTAASYAAGTSGATVPLLNTANTWSAIQTFSQIGVNGLIGGAGFAQASRTITANYSITATDYLILCDASLAARTITLLATTTRNQYVIKKIDTSTNACTVSGNGHNIDSSASLILGSQNAAVIIQGDNAQWWTDASMGYGAVPTIAVGAAAGTGATASITGFNQAGRISITTGTATTASATLATITFGGTVATAPQGCSLQAVGANATGQVAMVAPGAYPTTTGWTIAVAGSAIPVSQTYTYSYNCQ